MSLDGVHGFLDVESAALRAPQVGIANSAPQHILSVGSNLYVSGDSPDVLTVDGNVVCEGVKVGLIEIIPSYDLEAVSNVGNSMSNTIQFTNPDTGIVTTGNVTVGKDLNVTGNLNVLGTTTTIDTENLRVKDPIIELGKDNVGTGDLGLVMTRPSGSSNVAMIFDESTDTLEIGYTQNNASDTDITMQLAAVNPISVNVNGDLSVSSNVEVGTANLFVDTVNSRVGIGKTDPGAALDVVGDVEISSNLEVSGNLNTNGNFLLSDGYTQIKDKVRVLNGETSFYDPDNVLRTARRTILEINANAPNFSNTAQREYAGCIELEITAQRSVAGYNANSGGFVGRLNFALGYTTFPVEEWGAVSFVQEIKAYDPDTSSNGLENVPRFRYKLDDATKKLQIFIEFDYQRIEASITWSVRMSCDSLDDVSIPSPTSEMSEGTLTTAPVGLAYDKDGNVGIGTNDPKSSLHINSTGAMITPIGTTAERPTTALNGMFRLNQTENAMEYYNGNWIPLAPRSGLPIVTNGLAVLLDASDFTSYPISGSTWFDRSGNGRNGTLRGSVSWVDSGQASYFDFSGVDADYIDQTSGSSLVYKDICIVFNVDGMSQGFAYLVSRNTTIDDSLRIGSNNIGNPGNDGDWSDGNSGGITYYVNGVADTNDVPINNGEWYILGGENTNDTLLSSPWNYFLGTGYIQGDRNLNGKIAFVALYDRVLTSTEQLQNYNALKTRFGV